MLRQSRKDCYDATVVILNLQGFQNLEGYSNIIINNGSSSSSKHISVANKWRACHKVSHPQKTKG
ncbi:MAG: hypothetical protein GDA37_09120 [Ekhidna sp.]|nr:hypothetical protein [Ekhidna sp.]